ncbi:protein-tyrosine phosphatase family protein [Cypionkella sp.]|uniref:phosphatase domain-containing putative toxin n=1 Tax=Cypionkella sp. TaxID=2811411 RepID=UPI002ABBE955|nr:protein-tyrosine phosphatase family protein [Cypionkella sp.]MDZ4392439.1 protein-tyrosine phosphatase family protein [Cypionkella sp.]
MRLTIAELAVGQGVLGISPCPGRAGFYEADLIAVRHWQPSLVVTFITYEELERVGPRLGFDLEGADIAWAHLPTADYDTPGEGWDYISIVVHSELEDGHKVLLHCMGGCGRSGTAALRLMIEAGEGPEAALNRLRKVRPCAVETPEQFLWASQASNQPRP